MKRKYEKPTIQLIPYSDVEDLCPCVDYTLPVQDEHGLETGVFPDIRMPEETEPAEQVSGLS